MISPIHPRRRPSVFWVSTAILLSILTLQGIGEAQSAKEIRWLSRWEVKWTAVPSTDEASNRVKGFPVASQALPADAAGSVIDSTNAMPKEPWQSAWVMMTAKCQFDWPRSETATIALDIPPKFESEPVLVLLNGIAITTPIGRSPLFGTVKQGVNEIVIACVLANPSHLRVRVSSGGRDELLKELEETYKTARTLWSSGDRDDNFLKAARLFETMPPLEPIDESRYFRWWDAGDLYKYLNRPVDANRVLKNAISELPIYDPRHMDAVKTIVRVQTEGLSLAEDSARFLEKLLELHGRDRDHTELSGILARLYVNVGDVDRARALYEDIIFRSGSPEEREKAIKGLKIAMDREQSNAPAIIGSLDMGNLLNLYQARAGEGKWSEALPSLVEALRKYGDSIVEGTPILAISTRTRVQELLAEAPAQAKAVWNELYGAELATVLNSRKREEVEAFWYAHPFEDFARSLCARVGDLLAEEGNRGRAAQFYRRALASPGDSPANASIQARLDAIDPKSQPISGSDYANPPKPLKELVGSSLPMDRAPLALREWQAGWVPGKSEHMPSMPEEYVPYVLSGDHKRVFFNAGDRVYALDPMSGQMVWKRETTTPNNSEPLRVQLRHQSLSRCSARFYTSSSEDAVFYRLNWEVTETDVQISALFAARKEDGALLWSTEGRPEFQSLQFNTDPVYGDGVVVAGAWEPREVPVYFIVGVDALTGNLLWKTNLFFGAPFTIVPNMGIAMGTAVNAPQPAIINGTAYYISGASIIAAVDVLDGSVKWLREYKRSRLAGPEDWGLAAALHKPTSPAMDGGKAVLVSPQESKSLYFMDPADGRLLHEYSSLDYRTLIGVDGKHAFIQKNHTIVAINLDNYAIAWETVLPSPRVFGSPTMSPRGILCPTWTTLYVVDPATGRITESRPWSYNERGGNFLDLGDRLVGAHHSTVKILGPEAVKESNWWMPRGSGNKPAEVVVTNRQEDLCRWMLPAQDRGNFFLSSDAPDHMIMQAPDTLEMRLRMPLPTLLWERGGGPTYAKAIQFDSQYVVEWWPERIVVRDAATGEILTDQGGWQDNPPYQGALPDRGDVVWFNTNRMALVKPRENRVAWRDNLSFHLRGIHTTDEGIGVYLEGPPRGGVNSQVVLYDRATGTQKFSTPIVKSNTRELFIPVLDGTTTTPRVTDMYLHGLRAGNGNLVSASTLNQVDWKTGQISVVRQVAPIRASLWRATRFGVYIVGQDANGGVIWILNLKTGVTPTVNAPSLESVFGNKMLSVMNSVVLMFDLDTGQVVWRSRAFPYEIFRVAASGDRAFVALVRGREGQEEAKVAILSLATGEVLNEYQPPSPKFGKVVAFQNHMYISDRDYVTDFAALDPGTPAKQTITQPVSDPMAAAAVHIARSVTGASGAELKLSSVKPSVNGDFTDWHNAEWLTLDAMERWIPDEVHKSRAKSREIPRSEDCSARLAVSQDTQSLLFAIDVVDDVHVSSPYTSLVSGDSVRMEFRNAVRGRRPDVQGVSFAQVNGIPCADWGLVYSPVKVVPDFMVWPAPVREILTSGSPSWFRNWRAQAAASPVPWKLEFAVYRDDASRRTCYEIRIPRIALPMDYLLWDIGVNDNDGSGRKGALELGAGLFNTGTYRGYQPWPGQTKEASS